MNWFTLSVVRPGSPGGAKCSLATILTIMLAVAEGCVSSHAPTPPHSCTLSQHERYPHAQTLLANALQYASPCHGMFDPTSGFPVEGWNNSPEQGLHLRAFTQLTAIGEWVELLSAAITGQATIPGITKKQAREQLAKVIHSLHQLQQNPRLSDRGLLVNFLALLPDRQDGPLAGDVSRDQFAGAFGITKGHAIWNALADQKWIEPRNGGLDAEIKRGIHYGAGQFKGALTPYNNEADRTAIMEILDQRVVTIIFGDNANLSASVGKAIGTLMHPDVTSDPELTALRDSMESFIEAQRPGYEHLYDTETGRFFFGWDATRHQWFGWDRRPAHHDYFINEFRGPTLFVVLRYGFPSVIPANMGSILKLYRLGNGVQLTIPAAWDGSAFQILGLGFMMDELQNPAWKTLMSNAVRGMLDFSDSNSLPGLLSESYSGRDVEYTGRMGIPGMAVTTSERIVTSPSLYTLGGAYQVDPEGTEAFLARHWKIIGGQLLSDHGPWEGFNVTTGSPIMFQTSAHTLALALGLLGTGPAAMRRYLDHRGLTPRLAEWYKPGEPRDLLMTTDNIFAWSAKGALTTSRATAAFRLGGTQIEQPGIALVAGPGKPFNLSGVKIVIRYLSARTLTGAALQFKPEDASPAILNQAIIDLDGTGETVREISIIMPATPGLNRIREIVLTWGSTGSPQAEDFSLLGMRIESL